MSQKRGCFFNSLLFLILVFVPILGHIMLTVMVLQDEHSAVGMFFWLLVIWLIPFIGPLCYLLFGQKRSHVHFGQPSYVQPYQYQQQQSR